ncbi:MAG: endonuclease [Bacilli bacterium]|nr:endonuclease [Bacilli bacterium]
MKKYKITSLIISAFALVLSGCVVNPRTSSTTTSITSENTTTSAISTTSEDSSPSSATSLTYSSSASSSTTTSSNDITSSIPSSSSSSSQSSSSSSISSSSISSSSASSSSSSSYYSVPPIDDDPTWNINLSLRGAEFRNALQSKMAGKRTQTTTYNNCLSVGAKAAAYPNASSSTFVPFYHDATLTATTGQCNREHTWPNSRGTGKDGPGADPFIIRPTLTSENSSRGNKFYGLGSSEWDPACCGFEGARGESARVILYAATMYYRDGLSLSNNPGDATSLKTMGTLSTLLAWNAAYAPTPIEIQINNYLSNNGYGRNPFVDHPEYASYIWNNNGLIGGEIPPDPNEFDDALNIESTLSNIDGNEYVIASSDSSTSFNYYAMDNEPKADNLPWYIKPIGAVVNDDKTKMIPSGDVTFKYYKFIKQSDGNYYIQNKETNKYIFGYIDGSHYSIGLGTTPTNNGSLSWSITTTGKGFVMKNAANVYLEYYNGSYCGYSRAPSIPIYLFH